MWRPLGLIASAGLVGCSSLAIFAPRESCTLGRQRSLSVVDTLGTPGVELSLVEYDKGPDDIQWAVMVRGQGDDLTFAHLNLRTPGQPDRMILDLTRQDSDPGPDLVIGDVGAYTDGDSMANLINEMRSGLTYISVQLGGDRGKTLRYDITNPEFSDWDQVCGLD
ncbi:MAG: hypothetical protein ACJ8AQ_03260 [Gemmatimonadales bacterium]